MLISRLDYDSLVYFNTLKSNLIQIAPAYSTVSFIDKIFFIDIDFPAFLTYLLLHVNFITGVLLLNLFSLFYLNLHIKNLQVLNCSKNTGRLSYFFVRKKL